MNFLRSLITSDHWINNAVPAGIVVTLFALLINFFVGIFFSSSSEKLDVYERLREDAQVFVEGINEVRLRIKEFSDLPVYGSAGAVRDRLMSYADLRGSTNISLERESLLSRGHSGERIVRAYDSAIQAADNYFACLVSASEEALNFYSRQLPVFLRVPTIGDCSQVPDRKKIKLLPTRDHHIKAIVAALLKCEMEISAAVEKFSRRASERGAVPACHHMSVPAPFTFLPSLDLLQD